LLATELASMIPAAVERKGFGSPQSQRTDDYDDKISKGLIAPRRAQERLDVGFEILRNSAVRREARGAHRLCRPGSQAPV